MSNSNRQLFSAFIAKSFDTNNQRSVYLVSTEALTYLLYKKFRLGSKFSLRPIKKAFVNKALLTKDLIDKEWSVND